jgi:L-fuconolactonase
LCRGIVGHADLRLGDAVARVLEAQITAGDGRFRGIRHFVTWGASDVLSRGRTNSPKGQMYDSAWRAGLARLAPLNLTFEAWLYHPQLADLADLARAFPQTTIILNHVGGPVGIGPYKDKKTETFAQWRQPNDSQRSRSLCSADWGGGTTCCSPSTDAPPGIS